MTDSLIISGSGPRFYRHSGIVPPRALALGLLVAIGVGVIAGALYGYVELYVHLIPAAKVSLLLALVLMCGEGFLIGRSVGNALQATGARSSKMACATALLTACLALYSSWIFYIKALFDYSNHPISPLLIARPDNFMKILADLCQSGVWKIGQDTVSGIRLALIWLTEAFAITVIAIRTAFKIIDHDVYCETCQRWGTRKELMQVNDAPLGELRKDLKAGSVKILCAAPPHRSHDNSWCNVYFEGCPRCDNLQTLTVTHVVYKVSKDGKGSTKSKSLVKRMLLPPEQILAVIQAAADHKRSTFPPAESDAPAGKYELEVNPGAPSSPKEVDITSIPPRQSSN